MGTSLNSSGLRLEDHHTLKYSISLNRVGLKIFWKVFNWGFKEKTTNIKKTLFELPNYNNTRFRKDFNASQREKINKGDSSSMDITLIYKLLQLVCGLRDASDDAWVTPDSYSLEYCLYAIKMKRNEIAHEGEMMLSSAEMNSKLDELKQLFIDAILRASSEFCISNEERDGQVSQVSSELDAIKDSPVPLPTVAEHEKEVFANRRTCIIDEGRKEMLRLCDMMCQISVVPCLTDHTVNVNDLYTEPKLRRDETQITQRQLSLEDSYVGVNDIFESKDCDGFVPDVIVVSALNGMGRSTLLKYIVENGLTSTNVISGMEHLDLILYLECRKTTFSSVDELASLLLPRTSATFQPKDFTQCLLSIDFLFLLDDIDELDSNSFAVFEKFVRLVSPGSRIVLTASREKAKYVQRKVSGLHKRVMLLEVEGINECKTLKHLQRVLKTIPSRVQEHNEQELYELIKSKYPSLQEHLRSPEVLGLIAFGWSYAPDRVNMTTTVSEIFLLVEDLLVHKIYLGLISSSLPSIHDQEEIHSNLYEFLLILSSVANDTLRQGRFSINSENLQKILCKSSELKLPKSILSLFLSYTDDQNANPFILSRQVSFPRRSTLHYYAAWFITQEIKEASPSATIKELMKATEFDDASETNYQSVFKYVVGMLAALVPSQLQARAKEIVGILKELNVTKASQWLQYIEEAKTEPTITQEILNEMGDKWEVEDYSVSLTLQSVLQQKRPSSLVMTICKAPSDFPHLQRILDFCKQFKDIKISVHLYQHFWCEKIEYSDEYLRTLVGNHHSYQLEHFAGRLRTEALQLLPSPLKRLAIHMTPNEIVSLNRQLRKLPELQMLYINLDVPENTDPASITSLDIPNKSVILSVDMWRIHEGTVDWSCDVAKALSKSYARLVLRHSTLDANSCSAWLKGLSERNITVSWIVVGSIKDITKEEESQLQQCAVNIACTKFVWLKI